VCAVAINVYIVRLFLNGKRAQEISLFCIIINRPSISILGTLKNTIMKKYILATLMVLLITPIQPKPVYKRVWDKAVEIWKGWICG
jgi:hypothetical protein